uniref:Midasin n=1 Tax=Anthurium amnicola TaxID=1678845 RepID=A0A1D1YC50_9ARAE
MAWRLLAGGCRTVRTAALSSLSLHGPRSNPNPSCSPSSPFSTALPHLNTGKRKKKRRKKESPRTRLVQQEASRRFPAFEELVQRDALLRFITRTKDFLSRQPEHVLRLDDAGKLHRELGFPRGRKVSGFAARHPLLLQLYRHTDDKSWLGFTDLMEALLEEEAAVMDATESARVAAVRKLLMMSRERRIPLCKLHHCRHLFGLPEDFRERVPKYPDFFRVAVDPADGRRVLELVDWDPKLAVSALERGFVSDEDQVRRTFRFPVPHGKSLALSEEDERRMDSASTLPLVSPYSEGWRHDLWTPEAEKYRVGVIHEFLSLTLEKRASIHHIVEFKEEFSLTKHTYQMLLKQPRAFYLAGTEMNWAVFLREGYKEDRTLIEKDPLVLFKEKLYRYALMTKVGTGDKLAEAVVDS